MSKLRSVSTDFWTDPFVEDLTPNEKLLFLYFITNDKTNMLGIYEVSIRKICFDTSIKKDIVESSLKKLAKLNKIKYVDNHIILVNFLKHQNFNTNMKKSAIDVYNSLPKTLKNSKLTISKSKPLEGFESLLNHYGMVRKVEVEVEVEDETEEEEEEEVDIYLFDKFWDLYDHKVGKEEAIKKYNKISIKDKKKIFEVVEVYVKSTPDKKYRKHPSSWLNQKCWNDEITIKKPQINNGYLSPI